MGALLLLLPLGEALAGREVLLQVGESKTIFLGKIKNVNVGNPSVIDVKTHADGDKIVVFGVRPGYSSLTVGDIEYDITVVGDVERLRKDAAMLLQDIPGVEVLTSGDRVVIDGVVKRRDDFDRIQAIVAANPKDVYSLVLLDERDIVRKAQIQLHFQVLEVNRNTEKDYGIAWGETPIQTVLDTISFVQFGIGDIVDRFGNVRRPDDLIDFHGTADVRRVLDKDFFTTISGEEVEFNRGKTLIFSRNNQASGTVTFYERKVGLVVKAMPVIDDSGDIDLRIEVEFSNVGELELGGSVPSLNTQYHKAHVQLREGESFALSGFFRREKGRAIDGLPGLSEIPGIGVLFGSRNWQKGETDGIIVVTPVLLDAEGRSMRKQIKETLDVYDAADVKF
jgi:pilus assembly protein CpaC